MAINYERVEQSRDRVFNFATGRLDLADKILFLKLIADHEMLVVEVLCDRIQELLREKVEVRLLQQLFEKGGEQKNG